MPLPLPRRRLSRLCYDKAHRCPGWAGGGGRSAQRDRCENGRIEVRLPITPERVLEALEGGINAHPAAHPFRFGHCTECAVLTLPWATRNLDPTYWADRMRWRARKVRWVLENVRTNTHSPLADALMWLRDRFTSR